MTFTDVLSQPAYPGAKPEEVAEVFIDKFVYSDWETVWVQHRWHGCVADLPASPPPNAIRLLNSGRGCRSFRATFA